MSDYTYNSLNQLVTGAWSGTLSAFGWTRTAGLSGIAVTAGQQQQAAAVFETGAWTAKGLVLPAGGIGGILAVTSSSSALQTPGSALYAYDGNGNVVDLVDAATAAPLAAYEYGPFGNTLVAAGPLADINPIRFSSKYAETARMPGMPPGPDLYYYGHRYYSPGLGRWASRDPIGERGGTNLYGFLGNDGLRTTDTLGLIPGIGSWYGNWCGKGYSDGMTDDARGTPPTPPIKWNGPVVCPMDKACRDHDACFHKCIHGINPRTGEIRDPKQSDAECRAGCNYYLCHFLKTMDPCRFIQGAPPPQRRAQARSAMWAAFCTGYTLGGGAGAAK